MRIYERPQHGDEVRDRILDFIEEFKRTHDGCSPTGEVIGEACHLSPAGVYYHLKWMARDGLIILYDYSARCNIGLTGRRRYVADADRVAELEDKLARVREILGE